MSTIVCLLFCSQLSLYHLNKWYTKTAIFPYQAVPHDKTAHIPGKMPARKPFLFIAPYIPQETFIPAV